MYVFVIKGPRVNKGIVNELQYVTLVFNAYCVVIYLFDTFITALLLNKLYENELARIRVSGTQSQWLHIRRGVRQVCVHSPYRPILNILTEMVMRETLDGEGWIIKKTDDCDQMRINALNIEMEGLWQIIKVSRMARKTNESLLEQNFMKRQMLGNQGKKKLKYVGHIMRKHLEIEIMQGTYIHSVDLHSVPAKENRL